MRIISGSKKGLRLKGPKGKETRPTEDRIKESLFNILFDIDRETLVLDLFAGSGSVGLEFLSRGAEKVYFVDRSKNSIECLYDNIRHTKSEEETVVLRNDFRKAIDYLSRKELIFDYIFIDPPYEKGLIKTSLEKISEKDILKEDGLIIIERESKLNLNDEIEGFIKVDERSYGAKTLAFYRYKQ